MTESVAPLRSPRAPDVMKGRVPMAKPLPERWLRPRSKLGPVGLGVAIGLAAIPLAIFAGPVLPFLPFVLFSGLFIALVRMTRSFNRDVGEAARLLHQGKNEAAEQAFIRLTKRAKLVQHRGAMLYNLGLCAMQRGDVERALPLLQACHTSGALRSTPAQGQAVPFMIGLCYAALGDLDGARAWLDEGRRLKLFAHLRHEDVLDAMLLARERNFSEARARIENAWLEIEASFSAGLMRSIRVLRAFIVDAVGEKERARGLVEGCKPFIPGENRWLGVDWPEMQAFLVEHRLDER